MKLTAIYFDAFRSLVRERLDLSQDCIGLVGINESGKTNVLSALGHLSPDNPLSKSDAPKMDLRISPALRYSFSLDATDTAAIADAVNLWSLSSAVDVSQMLGKSSTSATLHVKYDLARDSEERFFELDGLSLPKGTLVLKPGALTDEFRLQVDDEFVHLSEAQFITTDDLKKNEELRALSEESRGVQQALDDLEYEASQLQDQIDEAVEADDEAAADSTDTTNDEVTEAATADQTIEEPDPEVARLSQTLKRVQSNIQDRTDRKATLDEATGEFSPSLELAAWESEYAQVTENLSRFNETLAKLTTKVEELQEVAAPSTQQQSELENTEKNLAISQRKIATATKRAAECESAIASLSEPLHAKFTSEQSALADVIRPLLDQVLSPRLPSVVHWMHRPDYILEGEIDFETIAPSESQEHVPRPLLNLFRIGLKIKTLDDLRSAIELVQSVPGERSRSQDRINKRLKAYLTAVWPDYDQEIKVTLEQDRMRIEFYDPKCEDASYYEMRERSQGCQSFISFLLTIGAEAKNGQIQNTVLLLDEPETHLHPSGVRHMLTELKNAARNGNIVVFATHSIHMIDRDSYDSHAIVRKKNERTSVELSSQERLGFFMQEEVLYAALDVNTAKEFPIRPQYNVVVEGRGDALLYKRFYSKALVDENRPFPDRESKVYHGGKCSDMLSYFTDRPISLGATWIFLLDRDSPANSLRKYLEKRYKPFVGTYIFVFQYDKPGSGRGDVELEDLLPGQLVADAFNNALSQIEGDAVDEVATREGPFAKWLTTALAGRPKDTEVKRAFKASLNELIENTADSIADAESFEATLPDYYAWVSTAVAQVYAAIHGQPAEQDRPASEA